jgi:hypothetical protein
MRRLLHGGRRIFFFGSICGATMGLGRGAPVLWENSKSSHSSRPRDSFVQFRSQKAQCMIGF